MESKDKEVQKLKEYVQVLNERESKIIDSMIIAAPKNSLWPDEQKEKPEA